MFSDVGDAMMRRGSPVRQVIGSPTFEKVDHPLGPSCTCFRHGFAEIVAVWAPFCFENPGELTFAARYTKNETALVLSYASASSRLGVAGRPTTMTIRTTRIAPPPSP